jgi:hypothetical protein
VSRVRLSVAIAVIALVAVAVVGMLTGSSASRAVSPTVGTAAVTSTTLVCPDVSGSPAGTTSRAALADVASALSPPSQSTGSVTTTVLGAGKHAAKPVQLAPESELPNVGKTNRTIEIAATGSVAATLAADEVTETPTGRLRASSGVRCEAPATDWWFAGADGRVGFTDTLLLANPAPTSATVAVVLWSAKGPLLAPRLQAVRVAPRSTVRLGIAANAPDDARVAVHVHATSGSVTAALFDQQTSALKSDGGDYVPPTLPPARTVTVAGFTAGKGVRQLVIGNAGGVDATVAVRVVTASGSFTPTGDNQLNVRAGRTRVVHLNRAFDGTTGAVALTSDQPVFAQGLMRAMSPPRRPDLMWLAATPPISGAAPIADGRQPDGGGTFLMLSAPKAAAQVRVSAPNGHSTMVPVAAGHSVQVNVTTTVRTAGNVWPFVVTPVSGGPVYGVRVLYFNGAHGALITGEPLIGLPAPIPLPPVDEDQRIATGTLPR